MIIVLLGPPGSGKGTQAKRIQERYEIVQISTGDLFRSAMKNETELGRSVRRYIESGQLVPDDVASAVVADRIGHQDCRNGCMLDGYPRTLVQASAFDAFLAERKLKLDVVLYFDVSEQTAVDRLSGRMLCAKCGANYHLRHMPPQKKGVCDVCGSQLKQRVDDNPETIRDRLAVYARQTSALVGEYSRRGLLRRIDANCAPENVESSVEMQLDQFVDRSKV